MTPLRGSPRSPKPFTPSPVRRQSLKAKLVTPGSRTPRKAARKSLTAVAIAATTVTTSAAFVTPTKKTGIKPIALFNSSPYTQSFDALWAGNFTSLRDQNIPVHTLILGTHPSIKSLAAEQYYAHPLNAFWWVAGDCLGFRRATGLTTSGKPYKFTSHLRHGEDRIIPYLQQIETLASRGFALWDVVRSCQRKGSLDVDIRLEVPNDIREFCQAHPSIRRIVLANGGTGSTMFNKHFEDWWKTGQLKPGKDDYSQKAFGNVHARLTKDDTSEPAAAGITCISAISVSPAAAKYSYREKRDFWEEHVYMPVLRELERSTQASNDELIRT